MRTDCMQQLHPPHPGPVGFSAWLLAQDPASPLQVDCKIDKCVLNITKNR